MGNVGRIVGAWAVLLVLVADSGAAPKSERNAAVDANNAFALDLYAALAADSGENLFFSPFSIVNALSMVAEGAKAHTANEMRQVLHLPARLDAMHEGLGNLSLRYNPQPDSPAVRKVKARIAVEQKAVEDFRSTIARLRKQRKWREMNAVTGKQRKASERITQLLKQVDPTEISVANALWGEKTYPFRQPYLDKISDLYKTGTVHQVDFKSQFEAERLNINAWAEAQTHEKITNLLPAGSLDEFTRLVLVNAIYFKGEWQSPFTASKTKNEAFTMQDRSTVKVPLMRRRDMEALRYGAFNADGTLFKTPKRISMRGKSEATDAGSKGFSMVELPYRGGKLAMLVIAPNSPDGLAAIEKQLNATTLASWLGQLSTRKVHVFLPRFRSETSYKLNDTLGGMGMPSAFRDPRLATGARFGGMTTATDPMKQLYIARVQHKAFVDVNEEGTEAAAATAVVMAVPLSMPRDQPFTPSFRADRPFFFCIRDIQTNCVLFVGRTTQPKE
jgi:serine protease inhibitor